MVFDHFHYPHNRKRRKGHQQEAGASPNRNNTTMEASSANRGEVPISCSYLQRAATTLTAKLPSRRRRRGRYYCLVILLLLGLVLITTINNKNSAILFSLLMQETRKETIKPPPYNDEDLQVRGRAPSWRIPYSQQSASVTGNKNKPQHQQPKLHDFVHIPSLSCNSSNVKLPSIPSLVMSNITRGLPVNVTPGVPWDKFPKGSAARQAARTGLLTYNPTQHGADFWINFAAANHSTVKITNEARCHMPGKTILNVHFPHAFQYLYACWSYWQYQLEQAHQTASVTPVFYFDPTHTAFPKPLRQVIAHDNGTKMETFLFDYGFTKRANKRETLSTYEGMLLLLYEWGVEFRHDHHDKEQVVATSVTFDLNNGYALLHPRHAARLRNLGLAWGDGKVKRQDKYYATTNIYREEKEENRHAMQPVESISSPSSFSSLPLPQITLLNREKNRRILNRDELVKAINQEIYQHHHDDDNDDGNIERDAKMQTRVAYFESAGFADQIRSMAETDILISPHGAQLSLIPFLSGQTNGECAFVHELFPHNYCIPFFFSSLAYHSGVNHSYTSFDDYSSNNEAESTTCQVDWDHRGITRMSDVCPPLHQMMNTVRQLVKEWQYCVAQLRG